MLCLTCWVTVPQAPVTETTITISPQVFLKNLKHIILARAKAAIFCAKKKKKVDVYSGIALLAQSESSAKFRMNQFFAQTASIS